MRNLMEATTGSDIPIRQMSLAMWETFQTDAGQTTLNQLANQQFMANFAQVGLVHDNGGNLQLVLVGTDKAPDDPRASLQLFARIVELLPARCFCLDEASWDGWDREQIALGWGLGTYCFDRYLRKDKPREWPNLFLEGVVIRRVQRKLASIFLARDLINTPANDLGTEELCARAGKMATHYNGQLSLVMGEELEKGYPAIYEVGKASAMPPALIDLRWGLENHPKLTLVGKGVVFDSGGLDLKASAGMLLMKKDMGGAAVAMALAQLVMANKLPVNLRLLIPTVENAVSGKAYRPGDIIQTRKGLTVEIGNTDAEGRVILCDALAEAVSESPDLIIDMATLTGACRTALGQDLPGYYTPSDEVARQLETAAEEVKDPVWRLPLWMPYLSTLKANKISDLNNAANTSLGGSITAALFLHEFVRPYKNWLHLDMYAWRADSIPGTPKGGEATALRALYRMLETRYNS